jgi:hypothetical protein
MTSGLAAFDGGAVWRAPSPDLAAIDSAVSAETRQLVHRVAALRSSPSPGDPIFVQPPLGEQLFDALANAKVLTSKVAMHLDSGWREAIFRQLDSLHGPDEWEAGDKPVEQHSFSTFLKAIFILRPERRPGLGLSHGGNLIAAWTAGEDRLTVEFLPQDRVRWVLSDHRHGGVARYAGDVPVGLIKSDLAGHMPDRWLSNDPGQNHQLA